MTNKEFVSSIKNVAVLNTAYAKGTFGQKWNKTLENQKKKQYPEFYSDSQIEALNKKAKDSVLYVFDCVGLIKGVIWGFPSKIIYKSNGLDDVNDSRIWGDYCIDKSKDFSNIMPGEIVHITGHVGVYIGDGKVIEATNRWTKNVLVSSINKGDKYFRSWAEHGKLKLLNYEGLTTPKEEVYIVKPGDNLSSIAAKYGTTWRRLFQANPNIINPDLIYPGQKIIIK